MYDMVYENNYQRLSFGLCLLPKKPLILMIWLTLEHYSPVIPNGHPATTFSTKPYTDKQLINPKQSVLIGKSETCSYLFLFNTSRAT